MKEDFVKVPMLEFRGGQKELAACVWKRGLAVAGALAFAGCVTHPRQPAQPAAPMKTSAAATPATRNSTYSAPGAVTTAELLRREDAHRSYIEAKQYGR